MENKRELIIKKIRQDIQKGVYAPNDKLPPERKLAEDLGVSRVLLREAIVALETLGILEVRLRQGIFVKEQALQDFNESLRFLPAWHSGFVSQLMEIRMILDVHAAELAAQRCTKEELDKLKELLVQLEVNRPHTTEEMKLHARYEFLIHTIIVEAAHNPILSRIYEGIVSMMEKNNEFLHVALSNDQEWVENVISHHRTIIGAIEEKNSEKAGKGMKKHINESTKRFNQFKNRPEFSKMAM
jgi:GntR family transcriptional repressor for pyruvate dehydrogenase complex